MENQIHWKRKFSLFLESLVDTVLETTHIAVYILLTYFMSLIVKYTLGEINKDWADFAAKIPHGALLVVSPHWGISVGGDNSVSYLPQTEEGV